MMNNLIWIAAGTLAIIATVWFLKRVEINLNRRTHELKLQRDLMSQYTEFASKFIKKANPEKTPMMMDLALKLPEGIQDGSFAWVAVFSSRKRQTPQQVKAVNAKLDSEFRSLTRSQKDTFMKAVGTALIASTYSRAFTGHFLRRSIGAMVDKKTNKVCNQEVIAREALDSGIFCAA